MLQLLRSHKDIAAQMKALRESIEHDFKKNIGVLSVLRGS
jgi:hypoxanthine-guanine phosphoribosyltransferase